MVVLVGQVIDEQLMQDRPVAAIASLEPFHHLAWSKQAGIYWCNQLNCDLSRFIGHKPSIPRHARLILFTANGIVARSLGQAYDMHVLGAVADQSNFFFDLQSNPKQTRQRGLI